jgi:hypothetical protein
MPPAKVKMYLKPTNLICRLWITTKNLPAKTLNNSIKERGRQP